MLVIIDGYTDEPAGLGVPPYLGTYPRYVWGAAKSAGEEVEYLTIDELRKGRKIPEADMIVAIAGVHTPGKYLTTTPATASEIAGYLLGMKAVKILGGPAGALGSAEEGGRSVKEGNPEIFDYVVAGDVELFVHNYLKGKKEGTRKLRDYTQLREFAVLGAGIIKNPDYLIAEIETSRGCAGCCSFCTEPVRYGKPEYREQEDITEEVGALYSRGVRHFRIGRQPCMFSYKMRNGKPQPGELEKLFSGIRKAAPELKTLHVDNANPGVIAENPEESRRIAGTLVGYCTPGNVLAFGMESADPKVIEENNLNSTPEQVFEAIKLINEVGGGRGENGMPTLLPGINFVFGLAGETKKTFELNFEFLKKVLDSGLMLRRINLRQVAVFPYTKMSGTGDRIARKHKQLFAHCKYRIRHGIDREMLKRVVPEGTVLKELRTELQEGGITFARQMGSYPILVGITENMELGKWVDARVVDWGFRSVTAVPHPLDLNACSKKCLGSIPGIGKKRAEKLLENRPLDREKINSLIEDKAIAEKVLEWMKKS